MIVLAQKCPNKFVGRFMSQLIMSDTCERFDGLEAVSMTLRNSGSKIADGGAPADRHTSSFSSHSSMGHRRYQADGTVQGVASLSGGRALIW